MGLAELVRNDYMIRNDFNCAEAMLRAANEAYDLGLGEQALRVASPFGGGMGYEGSCGALTGGLMALGVLRGTAVAHQDPELGRLRDEFVQRFRERFGSVSCNEIKPVHRTPERGCSSAVEIAAEILEELLSDAGPTGPDPGA